RWLAGRKCWQQSARTRRHPSSVGRGGGSNSLPGALASLGALQLCPLRLAASGFPVSPRDLPRDLSSLDPQRTLPGRERVQENPQPRRQESSTGIDSGDRELRGSPLRKQAGQLAAGDRFIAVRRGQEPDAVTPVHERADGVEVVTREWPRDMDPNP